uniref:KIND domain-containing protein n=1 Tax=Monopterus albus TaxID=43700 RepID=A0A3Q3J3G1_MONAL
MLHGSCGDGDHNAMNSAGEAGAEHLSLEEILRLYNQPINEEQAWAVCYQCCKTLAEGHRSGRSSAAAAAAAAAQRRISGPGDVRIHKDGSVMVEPQDCEGKILHNMRLSVSKGSGI